MTHLGGLTSPPDFKFAPKLLQYSWMSEMGSKVKPDPHRPSSYGSSKLPRSSKATTSFLQDHAETLALMSQNSVDLDQLTQREYPYGFATELAVERRALAGPALYSYIKGCKPHAQTLHYSAIAAQDV